MYRNSELNYRLFFGEEDLPGLRQRYFEEKEFADLRSGLEGVDRDERRRFLREKVNLRDPLIDLAEVTDLAEKMAFLYLMTGDRDAAELAIEAMRALMRFPVWDFFLSGGEVIGVQRSSAATVAVSVVSDWLGDAVEVEERRQWLTMMAEKGCEPCFRGLRDIRYPRRAGIWTFNEDTSFYEIRPGERTSMIRRPEITQRTNLRAVPASALAFGTLAWRAEFGEGPEVERWLEMCTQGIRVFGEIYEEDGSYDEATNYANYTTLHLVQAIELFRRAGFCDLSSLINWKGYIRFVLNMSMPTATDPDSVVNFGDSGSFPPTSGSLKENKRVPNCRAAVPFWIAREHGDGLAQWVGSRFGGDKDFWALIWHDSGVVPQAPEPGFQLWCGDLEWAVARTGWGAQDLVAALRSGPPANHEHADRNSIIFKAFGEVLVADPNRPPYSYSDPSWILRLTDGHSAVLVDGRGHDYHNGVEGTNASRAMARIVGRGEEAAGCWLRSDATQAYRLVDTEVKTVARTLCILPGQHALAVIDYLEKYRSKSTLEARFFAYNNDGEGMVEARENGFAIRRPGVVLRGDAWSSAGVVASSELLPIPEEEARKHPYAALKTEASTELILLTVLRAGQDESDLPSIEVGIEGMNFSIRMGGAEITGRASMIDHFAVGT